MESDNNWPFRTYSGFNALSKKGKKKRKPKTQQIPSPEENQNESEPSQILESAVNSSTTDISELGTDDTINLSDIELYHKEALGKQVIFRDAMVSAPPRYIISEYNTTSEINAADNTSRRTSKDEIQSAYGELAEQEPGEYFEINTRALSKHASTYELEKFEKNALIIFNQKNIEGYRPRYGTEKDVEALKKTFTNFGFEITVRDDLTKDRIIEELKTFSSANYTDYGCVAVVVLTHGSNQGLLRAKDQQYSETEIINQFKVVNKPTLVTKPKVIIIQACRGKNLVPGTPVLQMAKIQKDLDEDVEPYMLPVESDILMLHSSYYGSPSHRDEDNGTWFIQELCKKIDSLASTHDLESIVTEVKKEVAINREHEEYNRRTLDTDINKQMPVMTSTLIRKLYLKKFGEGSSNVETVADNCVSVSVESTSAVLDNANPSTPLSFQNGSCLCYLDYFIYLRDCLKHFVDDNPDDETALHMWEVANTLEEGTKFNTTKLKMIKMISKHLASKAQDSQFYKYLHFYKQ